MDLLWAVLCQLLARIFHSSLTPGLKTVTLLDAIWGPGFSLGPQGRVRPCLRFWAHLGSYASWVRIS